MSKLQIEDTPEYEVNLKYEDDLKYEEKLKYEYDLKYEDGLKVEPNIGKQHQIRRCRSLYDVLKHVEQFKTKKLFEDLKNKLFINKLFQTRPSTHTQAHVHT